MLEPFIWMFKTKDFKEHLIYLLISLVKFIFVSAVFYFISNFFIKDPVIKNVFYIFSIGLFILPFLSIQGYFWELTECIISRDWDINAASVYNGKIRSVFSVELPKLNTQKFIWRGIASIIATILMFAPFILLMFSGNLAAGLSNFPKESLVFVYIFIISFIPALLWNYASTNSIFAVWNIRKAIYLMGNYTGKYIFNIVLFVLFYTLDYMLMFLISELLGVNNMASFVFSSTNAIKIILLMIFAYVKYFYTLYVYAYLLGTIAPVHEA